MGKHTPGPWKKFDSAFPQFFVCVDGKDICNVSSGDVNLLEAEANADLIAVAPQMFEVIKEMLFTAGWDQYGKCSPESMVKAEKLLASLGCNP